MIDLLSILPFNYIVMVVSGQGSNLANSTHFVRLLRIMRLARLLKLAKLAQLKGAVASFTQFLNEIGISPMGLEFILRVIGLICKMLCIVHFVGCAWLYIGRDNWATHGTGDSPVLYVVMQINHLQN